MKWTQGHSRNAVAARARKRIARADEPPIPDYYPTSFVVSKPRQPKADFIISIQSKRGERMQVSVFRYLGRVRTSEGQSARQFCRGLEQLLTKSA